VLDNTQDAYRATSRAWLGPISGIAGRLFVALAAIEVTISALFYVLRRDALDEVAGSFLVKFIVLSAVLMCITSAGYWLPPIVNGFARRGPGRAGGGFASGPSGIVDMGLNIALYKIDTTGLPLSFASLETALYALAVAARDPRLVPRRRGDGAAHVGRGLRGARRRGALPRPRRLPRDRAVRRELPRLPRLHRRPALPALPPARTRHLADHDADRRDAAGDAPEQMGELLAISVTFAAITTIVPRSMASRIAGTSNFGIAQALRSL
jgi:hypothetical protein